MRDCCCPVAVTQAASFGDSVTRQEDVTRQQQQPAAQQHSKNMKSWGFPLPCRAAGGQIVSPQLLAKFRDCERPEHAPPSPARAPTCAVTCTEAPCLPLS